MLTVRLVRQVLTEVVGVNPETSELEFDYQTPSQRGKLSTEFRYLYGIAPNPYSRSRLIPGTDRQLTQYFAYKRDQANIDTWKALKAAPDEVTNQFVKRTAIYLAAAIRRRHSIDAVMPAPSNSSLGSRLAAEIAARLGVPLLKPLPRNKEMKKVGVHQRTAAAVSNFDPEDQPKLNGNILVVDDFTTSGATSIGIAANLLMIPDVTDVVFTAISVY